MAKNNEQTIGCAAMIVVLLLVGSCCNSVIKRCSSSNNEDNLKTDTAVIETTNPSDSAAKTTPSLTESLTSQAKEVTKQVSHANLQDMVKSIPDDVRIVGVFESYTDYYQMIYCRKGVYYMQSISTAGEGKWGDSERMVKTSSNSYCFYEDSGEEFYLTGYSLIGYADGAEASEWKQVI